MQNLRLIEPKTRDPKVAARFWSKVQKGEGCWLWTASKEGGGYGQFSVFGRGATAVKAHRFSFVSKFGEIPEGNEVCHHCDTPACVRPSHLFTASHLGNMEDARIKGRMKVASKGRAGSANNAAKLSELDIPKILTLLGQGLTQTNIGNRFGVSRSCISLIQRRKKWKLITCQTSTK